MTRSKPINFLTGAAMVPLAALVVAGCGGASASTKSTTSNATTTTSARTTTIHAANSRLGKILVDSRGRTLYLFKKDSGRKSSCFGACAAAWPPLRASGKVAAGSGVKASLLGTTKRSDGAAQVTYNGHPIYLFVMDRKAGDTNGENVNAFGARWFVVSPAGKQIAPKASKAPARSAAPPASKPAPPPAAKPAPAAPPAPKAAPPKAAPPSNGIPQNGGGDGDADNNGGPSDGDGNI